jgi:serine/threonine protein kinase
MNHPMELSVGARIGAYSIERLLGRGGMGNVYLARQARPDRLVAIKLISPELANDPGVRARFERESELAARIEHPNVVPVYEVGEHDGQLYIAMRYVDGRDLKDLLSDAGAIDPQRTARIVAQIGNALDAAHAQGLVHRDVKPANVLIARS